MKFIIVSTHRYGGGEVVLRQLCKLISKKGHDAAILPLHSKKIMLSNSLTKLYCIRFITILRMFIRNVLVKLNVKDDLFSLLQCKEKFFPRVSDDSIVVYPEIVYGNPLHAKNVVRWFLYHNRFPNNPEAYGKDELVFSYREHFNDYNLNPTCRLLKLNYFNSELYKQTNFGEREGVCYIIRKGKNRKDLPKVFDGPIIDDLSEKEKVAVFNRCKYCYDYDTQTFYASIACVCGCIPIVMMEPGKTKADYLGKGDFDYGKAYGNTPEEIEYAIRTRPDRLKLLDFTEKNERNVDFFIQEIEKRFDSN